MKECGYRDDGNECGRIVDLMVVDAEGGDVEGTGRRNLSIGRRAHGNRVNGTPSPSSSNDDGSNALRVVNSRTYSSRRLRQGHSHCQGHRLTMGGA